MKYLIRIFTKIRQYDEIMKNVGVENRTDLILLDLKLFVNTA